MAKVLGLLLVLFWAQTAMGQGFRIGDAQSVSTALTSAGVISTPTAPATINVCNNPANAVPCTNKATTYTSISLGTPCSTSTQVVLAGTSVCVAQTDTRGNWGAWVAQGNYDFTITLSSGLSFGPYTISVGIPPTSNLVLGALTANGIVTTNGGLVVNGNANNRINVLNFQGTLAPITGNSADQTMYTYTLPANTVNPNQGFRITLVSTHSTGTSSVTYKLFINGVPATIFASASNSGSFNTRLLEMYQSSTTSLGLIQTTNFQTLINDGELTYAGLNWAANQVLTLTFNVANTDAVTPYMFLVEAVQ